ncbi:hypothetical protein LP418_09220 [Nocardioides sp. B-3]|nr:hypothetical protein [Nocardioides sp. B-3]UUZ60881.1 hypothetical protein LP418_09220 [Nocardioides sp. B-3]
MTDGNPGRPVRDPGGNRCLRASTTRTSAPRAPSPATPRADPEQLEREHSHRPDGGPHESAGACLRHPRVRLPVTQRRRDQQGRGRDEGDRAEEHPSPADGVGHERGRGRPEEGGQHPGCGEAGEDPGLQPRWEHRADEDVEPDGEGAAAQTPDRAATHEDLHRRGGAADQQPEGEQHHRPEQRRDRPAPVAPQPGGDHADHTARQGGGEAQRIEVGAVELARHRRHHRGDRHRLERHEADQRAHADRDGGVRRAQQARGGGGLGHQAHDRRT